MTELYKYILIVYFSFIKINYFLDDSGWYLRLNSSKRGSLENRPGLWANTQDLWGCKPEMLENRPGLWGYRPDS